jgi:hypothetical protein
MSGGTDRTEGVEPVELDEVEAARRRLTAALAGRGVETAGLAWLSADESDATIRSWIQRGAQRYGALSLNPPAGAPARSGEFADGVLPAWVSRVPGDVIVMFFRPSSGRLLARSDRQFVIENFVALARSDGDGFAAVLPDLRGVLLVNVEERLGERALDIDAWGDFATGEANR